MSDNRLFLLDGHALVYRAHFAFIARPLINSKGINTSAVTGFTRALWDLLQNQKPTHIAVAFDPPSPTFRHEMYEPYKANREQQPEDITIAFPYIRKILEGFKIPVVSVNGFEADDVIGTLAKQAEKEGYQVYMVTPDKDFGQLVSENIFLYKPARQGNGIEIMGPAEVCERWGIKRVDQVIDILGLMGDTVDNIPGIPGVGEKTAAKLLADFDSVEELIRRVDEVSGKLKDKIKEYADQGLLSKKLAVIETNVPIKFDATAFNLDPPDKDALAEVFKELEFRTLSEQILEGGGASSSPQPGKQGNLFDTPSAPSGSPIVEELPKHAIADNHIGNTEHQYHLVDTPDKRRDLVKLLNSQKEICFDTETTGIDANAVELVGMSFAVKKGEAYYIPIPEDQTEAQKIVDEFKPVLENEKIDKIGQNIKYDALVLKWYNVEVNGRFIDTMVIHYLLEPELRHNMDYLAESYLNYKPVSITTLIGKKGKEQITMRDAPLEEVKEYAAEDADITLQLKDFLAPKLEEANLQKLYDTIEGPLIKALVGMENAGININVKLLEDYSIELAREIEKLEKSVYEQAGEKFNLSSPKQVGEILFDKMKIPYRWSKTKTGQYSTDEDKLTELALENPFVEDILKHRGLTKLKSTYVDALPKMINPRTGRIHSSFNQTIAATGRLSSNNPNLQNIPVRTPEGAKVREAFIPRDSDHVLLAADYSQIELRLIAEISKDEAMLEAFQKGQDIHRATAARVFGTPFDEVTREQRYRAKTVNFSIIYGAGATNLSRQLGIKRTEAKELIDNYFAKYPGLKHYMDDTVEGARKNGYVTTLMGRRRQLRDIHSRSSLERSNAERIAINTPIQGSAADMIKIAMINIHNFLEAGGYQTRMVLQVHDELVFDAHKSEIEQLKPVIEEKMKTALPGLQVPILVEIGMGDNWLSAH
ncbi:MAG TPA: DNA polymerase I [Flavilitoribacter sp.]|nr:DNA polymerase I [Flavilitoribacter sp.]HMQ85936.1 DNA polymerase I [Flavilitoribacter sp.]